ncbi:hypothetical protein CBR_g48133 [Chara braunii]|uniref:Signal peptidase complex subunit 1 n=1 Tax=Chara braunii TaxID=69332 RepID=A0A388M2A8_CHABU|nr:hypothetical protein CBR_g48133 [Chara braunii]|eukprot:GBG88603.1 hypothetical protein CBR_g48133 [Chara braunii]
MDYVGQRLSEQLAQYTILLAALIALLAGCLMESYKLMMLVYAGGVLLAFVISVPDWPYFNQHPLTWLPPRSEAAIAAAKAARAAAKNPAVSGKKAGGGKAGKR